MKKRSFLLFEILIALSLIGILLSILFSYLVQMAKAEKKIQTTRSLILEREKLQARLQDLCISLTSKGLYTTKLSETESDSLIIFFDHGIDIDPLFSGQLIGHLFIDEHQDFCLAYWPISPDKKHLWRKEILCPKISQLQFEFLQLQEREGKKETIWLDKWPKEKNKIPISIRLTYKKDGLTLKFAFFLPCSHPIIEYESEL